MKHLGDICKIKGSEVEKVDVITFGAPCQDISIAGARAGIKHSAHGDDETTRSGLFFEALRIIREMREDDEKHGRAIQFIRPRYAIYENVGGLTSSNNGRDFQKVLTEFGKIVEPDAPEIPMPEKGGWPHADAIYGVGANGEPFSIAWRLHDAAKWGVPQRRKRYCVLADFNGFSAAEILFDPQFERMPARGMSVTPDRNLGANRRPEVQTQPEGMSGDSAEGGAAREGAAALAGYSAEAAISFQERAGKPGGGKGILIQRDRVGALSTFNNQSVLQIKDAIPIDTMDAIGRSNPNHFLGIGKDGDPQYTLSAIHCHAVCYGISAFDSNAMKSPNPHSGIYEASTARTLDLNGGSPACNQGGMAIVCLNDQGGQRLDVSEDVCGTLLAETHGHPPVIAVYDARGQGDGEIVPTMAGDHFGHISDYTAILLQTYSMQAFGDYKGSDAASAVKSRDYKDATDLIVAAVDCRNGTANPEVNGTLQAKEQGFNLNSNNVVLIWPEVRRLTPTECARLQGFPSDWLDIGDWTDENGKLHKESDAPKYKAAGNSIALPFWEWLARRICARYERPITMASLFDGVGGFPLAFSRCGAKPVWASEIEQYPIAVTKKHFPE